MTTRTDSWEDECEEMDQGGPPPKSDEGANAGDEKNTPDKEDSNQQNLEQIGESLCTTVPQWIHTYFNTDNECY